MQYRKARSYWSRPNLVLQTQAVPVFETEPCRKPIFLIGAHRSGTSLCRRIIDSHSRIACPPETHFLSHFAAISHDQHAAAGFDGLGFGSRKAFLDEIRKWSSIYHEAYRTARCKARWADKTPDYIRILPELEDIFGPGAQYIMIFRHPLEATCSIYSRGWRLVDLHPDLLTNSAMYVAESVQKQLAFARQHPEKCYRLYYENLVQSPQVVLQELFAFLNEPWEPKVLEFYNYDHNFGTEDTVVRGMREFKLSWGAFHALKPAQIESIRPILEIAATQLGYELSGTSVPDPMSGPETSFGVSFRRMAPQR